jgi:hypothetical protein
MADVPRYSGTVDSFECKHRGCFGSLGQKGSSLGTREKGTRREGMSGSASGCCGSLRQAGVYVTREPVMRRAKVSDLEEFQALAEYLYEEGSIAEADDDYGIFLLTPEGIAEIMR